MVLKHSLWRELNWGDEAPATVDNCQLGRDVRLKGGYFYQSTFLDKSSMGSGAHVRESCLLEEGAKGAHTVGLKQTILFPFVTLGSLINFCDCLMAGGTDEKNHSEVGSSYIHFNYTPDQDKTTPSLIGDVPRGVMINQPPIFLGGQGGLVGPLILEYGTVVAAGTIVRKDILKANSMLLGSPSLSRTMSFRSGQYGNLVRLVTLNTNYITNLIALRMWYMNVRYLFMSGGGLEEALYRGAVGKLESAIDERLKRMKNLALKISRIVEKGEVLEIKSSDKALLRKFEFSKRWYEAEQKLRDSLEKKWNLPSKDSFLEIIEKAIARKGNDYIEVIKGLNEEESALGVQWLMGLVNNINKDVFSMFPSMEISPPAW